MEEQPSPLGIAYRSAESDLAAVLSRLNVEGRGCHKERIGMPNALGDQVEKPTAVSLCSEGTRVPKTLKTYLQYFLKGDDQNLYPLVAFTIRTLQKNRISSQQLSQVLGGLIGSC